MAFVINDQIWVVQYKFNSCIIFLFKNAEVDNMQVRTIAIFSVMGLGVITFGIWVSGLMLALDGGKGSSVPSPTPLSDAVEVLAPAEGNMLSNGDVALEKDGQFRLLALGDSLTRGAGDVTGGGYVGYVAKKLEGSSSSRKEAFVLNNLGIDGLKAPDLKKMLDQKSVLQEIAAADVILLSIGGNDLFRSGQTLVNENQAEVDEIQKAFLADFEMIHKKIREVNSSAPLMMIGLYNPFGELKSAPWSNAVLRKWNATVSDMLGPDAKAVVVPTADLFQLETNLYLHGDQFHPNAVGYQRMAERVLASLPKKISVGTDESKSAGSPEAAREGTGQ